MKSGLGSLANPDPFDLPPPDTSGDEYTERDSAFVQEYLRREGAPDAAVVACINARISRQGEHIARTAEWMLSRPEIKSALKALRPTMKNLVVADITKDTVTADLEEIYQLAKGDRQYPSAIAAKKTQAQIHGLLDTTVNVNHTMTVNNMSTAQLKAIAAAGRVIDGEVTDVSDV